MKIKKYLFAIVFMLLNSFQGYSQTLRGMYINGFDNILGNTVKEDSLLMYLQDSSYNYMALYDLHTLDFSSTSDMNMLSSFIVKARQQYGIQYVGAVGETKSFFTSKIKSYNNSRTSADEKFNVFNLEFEFWTTSSVEPGGYYCVNYLQGAGCNCDTAGAFQYYMGMLHSIDSLAATQGAISETYLGWFNQGQGKQIQPSVDRILLHAYRVDNTSVWGYSKTRLGYLASNNQMVNVAPIFSSEPVFMGPWLQSHGQIEAYNQYETDFNADNSSWKQYINLLGYQWFDWGYMPKPVPGAGGTAPSISASGSTSFCPGGLVTLTSTVGTSYLWSNGATTRSVNVGSTGSYSCAVTQGGSTQTTNSISVNVYAAPTVSVIVNTPVNNTVPLSSNAIAGSGSISSYEWKLDNSTINGANTSEYLATESGDYSLVATNSYGCTNSSAAEAVVVPTTQCILTVPDGVFADEITESSAMLHWNSLPAADSIIIRYKIESSSNYIYLRLAYAEQVSFPISGLQPGTEYSWRMKTVCGTSTGSYSTKKYFTTSSPTGIAESVTHHAADVIVYPNPATTNIHLAITSDIQQQAQLTLADMTGKIIFSEKRLLEHGESNIETDVSRFAKGIYLLSIITETENILSRISVE
ncbi:MAG: T9SS type A sorting domain-containing protein [Bacteroidetes bacterium]|nr:T9SS type A sorting domain-containing protein [Bacteroidota bacterium]